MVLLLDNKYYILSEQGVTNLVYHYTFVYPYHVQVPSFGDWGFQLASKTELQIENLTLQQEGKFLTQDNLQGIFLFGEDERSKKELEVNSLSSPKLLQYYLEAEKNWE